MNWLRKLSYLLKGLVALTVGGLGGAPAAAAFVIEEVPSDESAEPEAGEPEAGEPEAGEQQPTDGPPRPS
jgi:hypothetical protein